MPDAVPGNTSARETTAITTRMVHIVARKSHWSQIGIWATTAHRVLNAIYLITQSEQSYALETQRIHFLLEFVFDDKDVGEFFSFFSVSFGQDF